MPHLHNGIGTWYIGKSNLHQTDGKCEFCGSWGRLSTYETRLWILIVFVPVIPLGKKQILDECPRCRRHRYMPLAKWKEIEANSLRKAMQQAEANADDPKAMLELHGTMIGFRRTEDALKLAEVLQADFPDNFDVQIHLGSWHLTEGRSAAAKPFFHRAMELKPDDLYAKQMVALDCIDSGDLPKARELLRGMDVPGPTQAPHAMLSLADAYHIGGEHANALEIYRVVLNMVPMFAQDNALRTRIRRSEEALGLTESMLPKKRRKLGKWLALAAVLLAVVGGSLGYNLYKARNQPLYVVNGLTQPVRVSIDGGAAVQVPPRNRREIAVAEGVHRAVISQKDEPDDAVEFKVESGFFERFTDTTAYVLNPAGAGVLLWQRVTYHPKDMRQPVHAAAEPYQIYFGEKFRAFNDIDYIFKQPPRELTVDERSKAVTKTVLSVRNEDPLDILYSFPEGTPKTTLADFAESQLKQHPNDMNLLRAYFQYRTECDQLERCRKFLAGELAKRPIAVEWHRTYQDACRMIGGREELENEYRNMLEAEPNSSVLLYLMGRATVDRKKMKRYFEQAVEADPQNAYPKYALAHDYAAAGDFSKAKPLAMAALQLMPNHTDIESQVFQIRFALKEYASLEKELQQKLLENPRNVSVVLNLMQVQAAQGGIQRARETQSQFEQTLKQNNPLGDNDPGQLAITTKLMLHYLENDMHAILRECAESQNPTIRSGYAFAANLELGNLDEAEKNLMEEMAGKFTTEDALLFSLAWSRKGDGEKAAEWRKKAIENFRSGTEKNETIAAMLESGKVDLDEIDGLELVGSPKTALLAVLADVCKEHRRELLDYAEKINTTAFFPHHFLKRTIEEMKADR